MFFFAHEQENVRVVAVRSNVLRLQSREGMSERALAMNAETARKLSVTLNITH